MIRVSLHTKTSVVALALFLAACGGGGSGGGVVSTPAPPPAPAPTPTPSPTPTPTPTSPPQALGVQSGEASFENFATRSIQELQATDDTVTSTTSNSVDLTFTFDATRNAYLVSGDGVSSTFGTSAFLGYDGAGDAIYRRDSADAFELLTLFNPARLGSGAHHVTAGLWQRRSLTGSTNDKFEFDLFIYGFPTAAAGVPVSGTATYDVDLFGVASPLGTFPRSVIGDGTFSLDFGQGLFAMSGEAGEYNNDVDYSTCCAAWTAAGYLGSDGGLSGNFTYAGRDRYTFQASVFGSLFGPSGSEVAGSLLGGDGDQATFTGIFAGTREHSGVDISLSVLENGDRSYSTQQGTFVASQLPGEASSGSGAYYFPAEFGSIEFGADGSVLLPFGINDDRYENVTFTQADLLTAESNEKFDVFEVSNANGDYRLELFKPGPRNPEIELTYSSFGKWQEVRPLGDFERHQLSTWFSYGVRTAGGTLPRTGTADYSATILGSGERYTDAEALTLSGTSAISVDFAASTIEGTFDADAWTTSNEFIDLPEMFFSSDFLSYDFETFLMDAPGHSPGSIRGSLYGPYGEEIGGSFYFFTRETPGGSVDASYSGIFYGKRD